MSLRKKYQIQKRHLSNKSNRTGAKLNAVRYGTAHETANNSANADAHARYFENHSVQASYHLIVDSVSILELIPLDERALHVQRVQDRQTLGLGLANDFAIAISICRTGDFAEAYDRYVWAWAYVCVKFGWDPKKRITAHKFEDPNRRSDPQSWLEPNGVSWTKFLNDVETYVNAWDRVVEIERPTAPKASVSTGNENLIRKGDKGDHVKKMQLQLIAAGFNLPRFGADGSFGNETEIALRAFQKAARLVVDGIFGPQSASALDNFGKQPQKAYTRILRLQSPFMRGEDVKAVQKRLSVVQDGIFGPMTERAVRDFQSKEKIVVDGIVGPQTWNRLF